MKLVCSALQIIPNLSWAVGRHLQVFFTKNSVNVPEKNKKGRKSIIILIIDIYLMQGELVK